jgi:CP family cyanate transporter-like MFS transporter
MRAREHANVVALSAFAQSAGYLMATSGPLMVGLLYAATGGWYAPLGFLTLALLAQTVSGLYVGRPRYLEDGTTSPIADRTT